MSENGLCALAVRLCSGLLSDLDYINLHHKYTVSVFFRTLLSSVAILISELWERGVLFAIVFSVEAAI